jgi:hypothetical protein
MVRAVSEHTLADCRYTLSQPPIGTGGMGTVWKASVVVRIDNLVLDVEFARAEALGTPDPAEVEALAAELVRELESRQPDRWTRPVFTSS